MCFSISEWASLFNKGVRKSSISHVSKNMFKQRFSCIFTDTRFPPFHWHLPLVLFVIFNNMLVFWQKPPVSRRDERRSGHSFVSACGFVRCARTLSSSTGPCSHIPNQPACLILAALNCRSHNPLLNSSLSSLPAIMILWKLIDQGDYYRSLNISFYCRVNDRERVTELQRVVPLWAEVTPKYFSWRK